MQVKHLKTRSIQGKFLCIRLVTHAGPETRISEEEDNELDYPY